jgi:hypothetical protein
VEEEEVLETDQETQEQQVDQEEEQDITDIRL